MGHRPQSPGQRIVPTGEDRARKLRKKNGSRDPRALRLCTAANNQGLLASFALPKGRTVPQYGRSVAVPIPD